MSKCSSISSRWFRFGTEASLIQTLAGILVAVQAENKKKSVCIAIMCSWKSEANSKVHNIRRFEIDTSKCMLF